MKIIWLADHNLPYELPYSALTRLGSYPTQAANVDGYYQASYKSAAAVTFGMYQAKQVMLPIST
jgi:hypothetical protein